MQEVIKADLFFVVTTGAVVIVSFALVIALSYLIRILRNAHHITERFREEGDNIINDVARVRTSFVGKASAFLASMAMYAKKSRVTKKKKVNKKENGNTEEK